MAGSTWWMRAAAAVFDAIRPVEGSTSGPGYVHAESDVDLRPSGGKGSAPFLTDATFFWRVALLQQPALPDRPADLSPVA